MPVQWCPQKMYQFGFIIFDFDMLIIMKSGLIQISSQILTSNPVDLKRIRKKELRKKLSFFFVYIQHF